MDKQEHENEAAPKLRLQTDDVETEVPNKQCPKCNAGVPGDAVLCVQCGYDFRSGAVLKTATGLPHTIAVIVGVVVSVIVAAAAIVILINVFRGNDEPVPVVPATPAEEAPGEAAAPVPAHIALPDEAVPERPEIADPDPEPLNDVEPEPTATPDDSEEVPALAPAEEATEAVDPLVQEEEFRHALRVSLDERVPPYQIGDEVELRRMNGFVHRGELVAIRDGVAMVVDGEIRERVPVNELDRDSRLLVDQEFRDRLVESRLRAMLENQE